MQIQLWSTGQIVYSYGSIQVSGTSAALTIGLQYGGVGCNTVANQQSTSLSNQSYVMTWDPNASACPALSTVNHYEIAHDGAATLCAEPVAVLACNSATTPCPAANIINGASYTGSSQIINASINVTGTGALATPTESPPSFNIQPGAPQQTINLTWAAGAAGTATLGLQSAIATTPTANSRTCTNVARTASSACTMTVANTACISAPHHFEIQGPASGSTCASSTFTIKAWADAAQTLAYTTGWSGTLTQTGNPASLPNLGAFTIPNGSSTVSLTPITFPLAGTTTFSTTVAPPALAGATTCNFGGSTSCAFGVASCAAGFNCVETTANASVAADAHPTTGRLYTKLAGTAFTFDVVARKADGTQDTTYASDIDRPVTVELVDGSGATVCASRVALNPAVTSQTLTFAKSAQTTDQGRKSITFTVPNAFPDVRCRATDTTNTTLKSCSLDDFSIRPSAVTLNNTVAPAANAAPPPAANAATNTPTVKAGAPFTLQARTSAGTNYAGTLTRDANKLTAQTTTQVATLQSGGTVGTLMPATLTTNPATQPTSNATYSEVGYLYLAPGAYRNDAYTSVDQPLGCAATSTCDCVTSTASDANLSDVVAGGKFGCSIGNKTAVSLGRFVPDHFDTSAAGPLACPATVGTISVTTGSPAVIGTGTSFLSGVSPGNTIQIGGAEYVVAAVPGDTSLTLSTTYTGVSASGLTVASCPTGGLVYSGQPFSARVNAKNLAGTDTQNYMGVFAKAVTLSAAASRGGAAIAAAAPGGAMSANVAAATSFTNGTNAATPAAPIFSFATAPTLPTSVFVRATDTDSVVSLRSPASTSFEGGVKVVSGRIRITNAYGSERLPLPMKATVQYYDAGASWVTSLTDSLTSLTAVGSVIQADIGSLTHCPFSSSITTTSIAAGVGTITLPIPGLPCSTNITANGPVYLANVAGRATFGIFKSPLIYRRENY
jgi:hypothetical protein